MWRSPSGKQEVRGAKLPGGNVSRHEFPGHHLSIVADIAALVKLPAHEQAPNRRRTGAARVRRRGGYARCVPGGPKSRTRKVVTIGSAVAGTWIARIVWRRFTASSAAFSGSADTWPPVARARSSRRRAGAAQESPPHDDCD